ncbi:MAG: ankyrin repeat domain-containing protein, partial [Bacteroidia bacterium]|nr:ankyrin repeat domain-containing protein [Bacteroidia bacterium]
SKNKDITKFLLKENVEINVKPALLKSSSFKAYLPINEAIRNGWDDIVEELIENDVNLNNQDLYGDTPLHRTAIEGYTKVLNLLLEKGMDVNILDKKGNTPLHIASKYNRLHIVELLLNNGAIVDKRNDKGLTALCESSNQTASLLIKHGAQIDEFVVYKKPHLAIKNEIEIIANSNDSIYEDTYWQDEEDHRRWYDFAQFEEITSLANSTNEKDNKKALEKLENEKKEFEDFYFIYGWEILLKSRFGDIDGARKALFHGLKFSKRKSSLCSNLATTEFQEHKNIILAIRWWIESAKMQLNSSNYDRWTTHTPFLYLSYVHDSYKLEKVANLIIVPQTVRLDANEEDKLRTLLSTIDEKLLNIINNEIDTELIDKIGSLDLGI